MNGGLRDAAMWLAGFNSVQTLTLLFVGSGFAMKRFGVAEKKVGDFVGLCNSGFQCAWLVGEAIAFALSFIEYLHIALVPYWNQLFSILTVFVVLGVDIAMFYVYANSNGSQYLAHYYWLMIGSAAAQGLNMLVSFKVFGESAYYFAMGVACCGIYVTPFHVAVMYLLGIKKLDVDYWLITSQLLTISVIATLTAVCWTAAALTKIRDSANAASISTYEAKNILQALKNAISPMLMPLFAYCGIYCIYPIISPFLILAPKFHHGIVLICNFLDALVGTVNLLLCELSDFNISWTGKRRELLHLIWLFALPFLFISSLFFYILHHRRTNVAEYIFGSVILGGGLTLIFFVSGKVLQYVGFGVCYGNARGHYFEGSVSGKYPNTIGGNAAFLAIDNINNTIRFGGIQNDTAERNNELIITFPDREINGSISLDRRTLKLVLHGDDPKGKSVTTGPIGLASAKGDDGRILGKLFVKSQTNGGTSPEKHKLTAENLGVYIKSKANIKDPLGEVGKLATKGAILTGIEFLSLQPSKDFRVGGFEIKNINLKLIFQEVISWNSGRYKKMTGGGTYDYTIKNAELDTEKSICTVADSDMDELSASYAATFAEFHSMIWLVLASFTADGYARLYNSHRALMDEKGHCPTQGYSELQALCWWFALSFKSGMRNMLYFFKTDITVLLLSP